MEPEPQQQTEPEPEPHQPAQPAATAARPSLIDRPVPGSAGATPAHGDAAATLSRHLEAHCFAGGLVPEPEDQPDASSPLRVVTWNVWFDDMEAERRWSALLAEALALRPDVLCLQEVTVELHERMVRCESLQHHYVLVPLEHNGYYDVTIWLRRACLLAPGGPTPTSQVVAIESYMGRRCLYTDVTVRSGWRVRLATVHLESTSPAAPMRKAQLEAILPALKTAPWSEPLRSPPRSRRRERPAAQLPNIAVLTGDFNFCSCSEEDQTVAGEPGVTDLWPQLEGREPGWTEDTGINEMRFAAKPKHKQVRFDRVLLIRTGSTAGVGAATTGGALGEAAATKAVAAAGGTGDYEWRGEGIALLGTAALPIKANFSDVDVRVWPSDHFGLAADIAPPLFNYSTISSSASLASGGGGGGAAMKSCDIQ